MTLVRLPNNWTPRSDQRPLWDYLERGGKRAVCVAHRRWGKDDVALHFTATQALQRIGNYWHMLPQYNQARKSIWDAVNPRTGKRRIDEAFPADIVADRRETDMFLRFINGSTWQLVGSDHYDALVGSPPVGIVYSEYALADPASWDYLEPIVSENNGWAVFISTSRGNNHLKSMLNLARTEPGWYGQIVRADETGVFTPEKLEATRREKIATHGEEYGEAIFAQEYMCSFEGAILGAYYSKQLEQARRDGRIGAVPWITNCEVDTWWDLGVDDSMSIWFVQVIGKQFRVIDYYESTGHGLEHYAKALKERPYVYGNHYMPHDADIREMSSGDIAKSRREVAEGLGIKPVVVVKRAKNIDVIVQVHIAAVRNVLSQCWFDEQKCARGLSALEGYSAEYDEDKKVLSNRPAHDWRSHASDSFRTGVIGYRPPQPGQAAAEAEIESALAAASGRPWGGG